MTRDTFKKQFVDGALLDNNNLKARLRDMAEYMYDNMLKFGGEADASTLESMSDPTTLEVFKISAGGGLNGGGITTATGDLVYHDGTQWKYLHDISA